MGRSAAQHRNNFDAIRLLAALAVLWDHQHALMGLPSPLTWGNSHGGLAVAVFFALSGYLVTQSWLRDPHLLRFAWRRVLRIWPGLLAVVVLCVCVLGPLVSDLPSRAYLAHPSTWAYFQTLWLDVQFLLPGVFTHNVNQSVNGSLWTIPLEVRCYLALGLIGLTGLLRHRATSVMVLVALVSVLAWRHAPGHQPARSWSFGLQFGTVFAIGTWLACWDRLWRPHPWRSTLAIAAALALVAGFGSPVLRGQVPVWGLACAAIWLGTRSWPLLRDAGRWGDLSYGTYIYAFPVQQTLLWWWRPAATDFPLALAASTAAALGLAWLSWHLIEQPALRLKPRLASRASATT